MMDVLVHYREQMRYVLHEFVIMPDHLHLLLTPEADISIERALQLIKGGFSYRLRQAKKRTVIPGSFSSQTVWRPRVQETDPGGTPLKPGRRGFDDLAQKCTALSSTN